MPYIYLRSIASKYWYKSTNIEDYIFANTSAYKEFIKYYGCFNSNKYEGLFEFISLSAPKVRMLQLISIFESSENPISLKFLISIKNQIEKRNEATKNNFRLLYKTNKCFNFNCRILLSKIVNSQNPTHIRINEVLSKISKDWTSQKLKI